MLVLVLLALAGAGGRSAWAASLSMPLPVDLAAEQGGWTWTSIARCAVDASPLECVEARSRRALDAMLAPGGRAASGDAALEPEVVDKIGELSEILVEAAASVLEKRMGIRSGGGEDDDDASGGSRDLVEEGRGKKKKKIHKLIALVKLVLLVLVVKLKLAFLMMALQTLFQFKLVVMVFLILLCKKISLWAQLKNRNQEPQKVIEYHPGCCGPGHVAIRHHPHRRNHHNQNHKQDQQQVIYYEHAQHQHHYDEHGGGGWGGGHDEHVESGGGGGGGWSGLWGRSYDTLDEQQQATPAEVGVDSQTLGVQSGVYRAADGTRIVIRPPDAHEMAYSAQRPT